MNFSRPDLPPNPFGTSLVPVRLTRVTRSGGSGSGSGSGGALYLYDWVEQQITPSGAYRDADCPRRGTAGRDAAREINNRLVSVPSYAWLRLRGGGGSLVYEFTAGGGGGGCTITFVSNVCPLYVGTWPGSGSGGLVWGMEADGGASPFYPLPTDGDVFDAGTGSGGGGPPFHAEGSEMPLDPGSLFGLGGASAEFGVGTTGSGSGWASYVGGMIVEYTEYDLAACRVVRKWCVTNPSDCCKEIGSGSGGTASGGIGSGGSGSSGSGGDMIYVDDCLPGVGYLPATLTLHIQVYLGMENDPWFAQPFPMTYYGWDGYAHVWSTGAQENRPRGSPPDYGYRGLGMTLLINCRNPPDCHGGVEPGFLNYGVKVYGYVTFDVYTELTGGSTPYDVPNQDVPCSFVPFDITFAPFPGTGDSFAIRITE